MTTRRDLLGMLAPLALAGCATRVAETNIGSTSQALSGDGWTNVLDHGATGDGTTDDLSAVEAAISAAGDGVLWVPPGTYRLAGDLVIGQRVHFVGVGGIGRGGTPNDVAPSVLAFDAGYGMIIHSVASSGDEGVNGIGSVFEHLGIRQHASESSGTDVVTQHARCVWRGVTIYGDPGGGHGWYLPAESSTQHNVQGQWYDCHVYTTGGDAWHIRNGNQLVVGGQAIDCTGAGMYCANVFGCTIVGLKLRGCNASGVAFQVSGAPGDEDGQGQHVALGCGVSGGNGTIRVGASSIWLGGPSSVGFTTNSLGLRLPSGDWWSPLKVKNTLGTNVIQVCLGVNSSNMIALQLQVDTNDEWRLTYDDTSGSERWRMVCQNGGLPAFDLTEAGHFSGAGNIFFPRGAFLGNGAEARVLTFGRTTPGNEGAPTCPRPSSTWVEGDRINNNRASSSTPDHWVCTTGGDPGTWTAV
jgi:hypothetical protein